MFCARTSSSSSSIRKKFKPLFWFQLKEKQDFFCKIFFKNKKKIFCIENKKFKLCSEYSLDQVKLYILIPVLRGDKELGAAADTHTHAHSARTSLSSRSNLGQ